MFLYISRVTTCVPGNMASWSLNSFKSLYKRKVMCSLEVRGRYTLYTTLHSRALQCAAWNHVSVWVQQLAVANTKLQHPMRVSFYNIPTSKGWNIMGRTYSTHGGNEKVSQIFGCETSLESTTLKACIYVYIYIYTYIYIYIYIYRERDNIKMGRSEIQREGVWIQMTQDRM
jgi:hypothetical protein